MEEGYNGYTNRETWVISLWLHNDEPMYRLYQSCNSGDELVTLVFGIIYHSSHYQTLDLRARSGFLHDLGNNTDVALSRVNWEELAEGLKEEKQEV